VTEVRTVAVIGAGIMGSGIAAQAALAGYAVTLEDVNEQFARKGLENAARALDGAADDLGAVEAVAVVGNFDHDLIAVVIGV